MDVAREESLLGPLERAERRKTWESIPEADRRRLIEELARAMVKVVDDEQFEDPAPST